MSEPVCLMSEDAAPLNLTHIWGQLKILISVLRKIPVKFSTRETGNTKHPGWLFNDSWTFFPLFTVFSWRTQQLFIHEDLHSYVLGKLLKQWELMMRNLSTIDCDQIEKTTTTYKSLSVQRQITGLQISLWLGNNYTNFVLFIWNFHWISWYLGDISIGRVFSLSKFQHLPHNLDSSFQSIEFYTQNLIFCAENIKFSP